MTSERATDLTSPWRTSSRSTGGQECVEVASTPGSCLIRDSTQPDGTRLAVSRQAWTTFTRRIIGHGVV
jgi:hypothetical protein